MSVLSKAARKGTRRVEDRQDKSIHDPNAKKAHELIEKIERARDLYYNEANDAPDAITDAEYDRAVKELEALEARVNSALRKQIHNFLNEVGTEEIGPFAKVQHLVPMLSLEKEFDADVLSQWIGANDFLATPKLDGLSLGLIYERGVLARAVTRGNGRIGADVTDNARAIEDIPAGIPFAGKVEVRGEVLMKRSRFRELLKQAEAARAELPKSPRNLAAGSLRQLDPEITRERQLSFRAYRVIYHDNPPVGHDSDNMLADFDWLKRVRFRIPRVISSNTTDGHFGSSVQEIIKTWETDKEKYEFEIDGIVFCFASKKKQNAMGEGRKAPKYAKAFKWEAEKGTTELLGVEWKTGKTGRVAPTGLVKAIELSGATVKRVTLHNARTIREASLTIGDVIHIQRSGEVIPKFLGVAKSCSNGRDPIPQNCPSCNAILVVEDVDVVCPNENCSARAMSRVIHYVQTVKMDGIGRGIIEKMFDTGLIRSAADLYRLQEEQIAMLPKTGKRSVEIALKAIRSKQKVKYSTFLAALGCQGISSGTSEKLAEKFPTIDQLLAASISDIEKMEGFAYASAHEVFTSLQEAEELIRDLVTEVEFEVAVKQSDVLAGKTFVITGSMSRLRNEIKDTIKLNGGTVQSGVSSKTQFLVAGDNVGSTKLNAASKHGTRIITEDELFNMMGQ